MKRIGGLLKRDLGFCDGRVLRGIDQFEEQDDRRCFMVLD